MIRITRMSGTYYGKEINLNDEDDIDEVKIFVSEGTPCIIVEDLIDIEELDIDNTEVVMC